MADAAKKPKENQHVDNVCTSEEAPAVKPAKNPSWKQVAFKALWLLLYPLAFGTAQYMRSRPDLVESFFSQGIYPAISSAVGGVFSIFPFSFAEFLVYAIVVFLVVFPIVCIVKAVHRKLPLRRFLSWLLTIAIVGGAGCNAFYWMWGFNYYRYPLSVRMGLTDVDNSPEDLASLCFSLSAAANEVRKNLFEDAEGVFAYEGGKKEALKRIPAAYAQLEKRIALFDRPVYKPKPVLASELLSYAGISGIFIPFTEEANVNVDDPALLVGSSAAHEAAHYLGIASEDEANFVAYLACVYSGDDDLVYSGFMLALVHAGNALADVSSELYAELWKSYSDAVKRDFDQYNAYLHAHQGETAERVNEMNDGYLRAHGQTAGVASYGQMVDLLLSFYKSAQS